MSMQFFCLLVWASYLCSVEKSILRIFGLVSSVNHLKRILLLPISHTEDLEYHIFHCQFTDRIYGNLLEQSLLFLGLLGGWSAVNDWEPKIRRAKLLLLPWED